MDVVRRGQVVRYGNAEEGARGLRLDQGNVQNAGSRSASGVQRGRGGLRTGSACAPMARGYTSPCPSNSLALALRCCPPLLPPAAHRCCSWSLPLLLLLLAAVAAAATVTPLSSAADQLHRPSPRRVARDRVSVLLPLPLPLQQGILPVAQPWRQAGHALQPATQSALPRSSMVAGSLQQPESQRATCLPASASGASRNPRSLSFRAHFVRGHAVSTHALNAVALASVGPSCPSSIAASATAAARLRRQSG